MRRQGRRGQLRSRRDIGLVGRDRVRACGTSGAIGIERLQFISAGRAEIHIGNVEDKILLPGGNRPNLCGCPVFHSKSNFTVSPESFKTSLP